MSQVSIEIKRIGKKLTYNLNDQQHEFKPALNPKIYPLFCMEMVSEKLTNDLGAKQYKLSCITPDNWHLELTI